MIALALPVDCQIGRTCFVQSYPDDDAGPGVRDHACHGRTYQAHDGTDFRLTSLAAQRLGVAVRAAAAGTVLRVRDGVDDVSVRQRPVPDGQDCGNGLVIDHGGGWQTQYCHMVKGSLAVKPGQVVAAGATLGLVGLSGNTEFPHLHLTVRQDGKAVDPFAYGAKPGQCGGGRSLWAKPPAYVRGAVLQAGFAPGPVTMDQAQAGGIPGPTAKAPALVAWVQAIGLEAGDVRRLTVTGPDGGVVAEGVEPPLDRDKAQILQFAGRKVRGAGWPSGLYRARFTVIRAGKPVIDHRFEVRL